MKLVTSFILAMAVAGPAAATSLRITIQNDASANGFALTPLYTALHNENFDAFNVGETASEGVRTLAELGNPAVVAAERRAATTDGGVVTSQGNVLAVQTPNGGRPIFGGESVSVDIDVTDIANQRYFTFLSMVIPTNDLFIGSDNAIELFDADGNFNGDQIIKITGADIFDAGTEINDPTANPAFVNGVAGVNPLVDPNDPSLGTTGDENGVIRANAFDALARYDGLVTVPGFTIDPTQNLFGLASAFNVATITIEEIAAPVPLPAGGALLLSGLFAGGVIARRKKSANKDA